jgi:hypothetical protein
VNSKEIFIKAHKKAFPKLKDDQLLGFEWDEELIRSIIFRHTFAIAFWGNEFYYHFDGGCIYEDDNGNKKVYTLKDIRKEDDEHLIQDMNKHKGNYHWYVPIWQYHLQQMVLEKDPLKYLKTFL